MTPWPENEAPIVEVLRTRVNLARSDRGDTVTSRSKN
jgi:hypothetical protein